TEVLQVHVAGHELGEGIDDGDDRLAEIAVLHAGGAPEAAGTGHVAAVGRGTRAIAGHRVFHILAPCGAILERERAFSYGCSNEARDNASERKEKPCARAHGWRLLRTKPRGRCRWLRSSTSAMRATRASPPIATCASAISS